MGDVTVTTRVQWRNALGQFSNDIDRAGELAIEEASREGAALAAAMAPKKSGWLAGAIEAFGAGASGGWRFTGVPHGMAQEKGARPHPIPLEDDPDKILANKAEGFFAKGQVQHPGNPAVRFMQRAYDLVYPTILRRIGSHI